MNRPGLRDIVLVVDDSPDTLRMLTDAIEDAGKTVLVAREGTQALAMIEKIKPDIILMDAVMPGMDGFETCRHLKNNKGISHVPVIFMTGLSDTVDIVKGLEAGGVDYVTKPIVPEELLARIQVHLGNARMAHNARSALDVFGRFLMAVQRDGRIHWCTPQAVKLLTATPDEFAEEDFELPPPVCAWLRAHIDATYPSPAETIALSAGSAINKLALGYVGQIGHDEFLLRILENNAGSEAETIRNKLALTHREAEVLMWIARGKSNRDVAEILNLSPRTVNKHLEQVYTKLGVENRTSAAAIAVRTLGIR